MLKHWVVWLGIQFSCNSLEWYSVIEQDDDDDEDDDGANQIYESYFVRWLWLSVLWMSELLHTN